MEMLPFGFGFGIYSIIPITVFTMFAVIICIKVVRAVKDSIQWKINNDTEILTVDAEIVAKRADVRRGNHHAGDAHHQSTSSTTYYITFELKNGDRLEFRIKNSEYGMLVEEDVGRLTYQGTRYLGFERNRN